MSVEENNANTSALTLYGYWRSSAAYRVRIALNLKGLSASMKSIHLVRQGGEQHQDAFRSINPQGLVPVLVHNEQVISQSLAICEYLDECFEHYPLLPAQALERARIRSMALQIACDIHPLNNLRVVRYLKTEYGDVVDAPRWMSHWMTEGFSAIEKQLNDLQDETGVFVAGQAGLGEGGPGPQGDIVELFGTDLSVFPKIQRVAAECRKIPAFVKAAPENQVDAEDV